MKSTIRKSTFKAIYRLLDRVSPIPDDCGKLCSCACCMGDTTREGEELGIYLLPGEEKLFTGKEDWLSFTIEDAEDFDFPDSWHGKIYFASCKNPPNCHRNQRPLQCRFFPVLPHLTEENRLFLIINDLELPYVCPLIDENMKLTQSFLKANYTVWNRLIQDPLIYDLVVWDSELREQIKVVYPLVEQSECQN